MLSDEDGIRNNLEVSFHRTIKKVGEDIENLKFNTAIASLMALLNEIYATSKITKEELKIFTILLNPFAPHVTEEVWQNMKFSDDALYMQKWPTYDEGKCEDKEIEIAVQINGKIKTRIMVKADIEQQEAIEIAKSNESIKPLLDGKNIIKEIYVKGKLINIVAK